MVDGEKPGVDMGYFLCRIVKYVRQVKKSVIFLYSTVLTATAARRVPFSLQTPLHGNSTSVHSRLPHQCNGITENIMPLPTRPLCCFRHYRP